MGGLESGEIYKRRAGMRFRLCLRRSSSTIRGDWLEQRCCSCCLVVLLKLLVEEVIEVMEQIR
eukprot:1143541-Prorocentrum_lima.AAC.1